MTLEEAADEFDRRAMLPMYGAAGTVNMERARIMACAQWLRDIAQDEREDAAAKPH